MTRRTLAPGIRYVVVVLGCPASGKSTISSIIADRWGLPVVSKDVLKEVLFDTLGMGDVAWSMKLGRASFGLLDQVIEWQLRSGVPFLIDAAYSGEFENAKFQDWQARYKFVAVQIHCTASPEELIRRFRRRALDGSRHPGHVDTQRVDKFGEAVADGRFGPLDLRGPVLRYDSELADGAETLLCELEELLPS